MKVKGQPWNPTPVRDPRVPQDQPVAVAAPVGQPAEVVPNPDVAVEVDSDSGDSSDESDDRRDNGHEGPNDEMQVVAEPVNNGSSASGPSASSERPSVAAPPRSPVRQTKRSPVDADLDDIEIERVVAGLVDFPLESPHDDDNKGLDWLYGKDDDDELTRELYRFGDLYELEQMKKFDVYADVPREDATTSIISTRWVRKLKSPGEARCRIVARECNTHKRDDTFAATPSAAGSRVIDMLAVKLDLCTCTADVSTAFLHAYETEDVFVEPPEGYFSNEFEAGTFVWKLKRKLYGLRSSPSS